MLTPTGFTDADAAIEYALPLLRKWAEDKGYL
jgi:hypothetical protein